MDQKILPFSRGLDDYINDKLLGATHVGCHNAHIHSCGLISRELEVRVWLLTIVVTRSCNYSIGSSECLVTQYLRPSTIWQPPHFFVHIFIPSVASFVALFLFVFSDFVWCFVLSGHIRSTSAKPSTFPPGWPHIGMVCHQLRRFIHIHLTDRPPVGQGAVQNGVTRRTPHDFDAKNHDFVVEMVLTLW